MNKRGLIAMTMVLLLLVSVFTSCLLMEPAIKAEEIPPVPMAAPAAPVEVPMSIPAVVVAPEVYVP